MFYRGLRGGKAEAVDCCVGILNCANGVINSRLAAIVNSFTQQQDGAPDESDGAYTAELVAGDGTVLDSRRFGATSDLATVGGGHITLNRPAAINALTQLRTKEDVARKMAK